MNRRILAAALLACAAIGAQAQTKKELAAKVVQLQSQGVENVGRLIAGRTSQQILQAAGQALQQRVAADKREAVGRDIQNDIKKFHDEIEPLLRDRAVKLAPTLAPALEERLSEEELKQVIAWLELPVSRKFAQLDSDLGNMLVEKVVNDTRTTVEAKVKTLESTIGQRLGGPAAPAASAPAKKKQ